MPIYLTPRVLVISHNSFSDKRNNGKTLEALFSEFPKGLATQLFFHYSDTPDFSFCDNYYRIIEKDVLMSLFRKNKDIGCILSKEQYLIKEVNIVKPKFSNAINRIKSIIGDYGRDYIWRLGKWKSEGLLNWIRRFSPQVIFFVGGKSRFSANIALELSSIFNIPLVSYYTDDYLLSLPTDSIWNKIIFKKINVTISNVIHHSAGQYVIGDYMASEYSKYFHKPFKAVMNSVSIKPCQPYTQNDKITISYFGGLHLNRWRMIIKLASILPNNAHIDVYTSVNSINDSINNAFAEYDVSYRGSLSGDDLEKAMVCSDILLHVESDDDKNRRFTRLAVSTKIPEYLITGRPILGYGPTEVASMKILSDNQIGYVIDSDGVIELTKSKVKKLIDNFELRKELGSRGHEYARRNFDKKRISEQLMSDLNAIVLRNDLQ